MTKPCKYGHFGYRYKNNSTCVECSKKKSKDYRERNYDKCMKYQKEYREKNKEVLIRVKIYKYYVQAAIRENTTKLTFKGE